MNNILIVLCAAAVLWIVEQLVPNVELKKVHHWYRRAFFFNGAQAVIAVTSTYLWDAWFSQVSLFSLNGLSLTYQVLVGYVTITFVYYWWHRLRHSIPVFWRLLHQVHHSPVRIEVITSFYKNPLEILLNGVLTSAILYILLGLSVTAVGLCVLITAFAEFIYHMNIKTPRVLGLFFQRPEMHRIHHQRGLHHFNYSDLPIWDMLFGTYRNPAVVENETGFPDDNENRVMDLLKGQELQT